MKAATATVVLVVALALCCAPLLSAAARGVERLPAVRKGAASTGRNAEVDCQKWRECLETDIEWYMLIPNWSHGPCVELLSTLLGIEPAKLDFDEPLEDAYLWWQRNRGLIPAEPYVGVRMWILMGQEHGCKAEPSAIARGIAHAPARKQVTVAARNDGHAPARKQVSVAMPRPVDCELWKECREDELMIAPLAPGSEGRCVYALETLLRLYYPNGLFGNQCRLAVLYYRERYQLEPVAPWVDLRMWDMLGKEHYCDWITTKDK